MHFVLCTRTSCARAPNTTLATEISNLIRKNAFGAARYVSIGEFVWDPYQLHSATWSNEPMSHEGVA